MDVARQVCPEYLAVQRHVVAVLVPDALAPAAADGGQPSGLAGLGFFPACGVNVGAGGEQGREELDLRFRCGSLVDRAGVRLEESGLCRFGMGCLPWRQFQQPQQARVLRPQPRCLGAEPGQLLGQPCDRRWLEIVVHRPTVGPMVRFLLGRGGR
jgi:hypothetical protein